MSSSLLLQHCLTYLVHLIWMVFEMGGRWLYSCRFVGCCFQDLFSIAHSILVKSSSSFFLYSKTASMRCIHIVELTRPLLGRTNSQMTFSYAPLHTNEQVLDDQLELINNSSVWTQDIV